MKRKVLVVLLCCCSLGFGLTACNNSCEENKSNSVVEDNSQDEDDKEVKEEAEKADEEEDLKDEDDKEKDDSKEADEDEDDNEDKDEEEVSEDKEDNEDEDKKDEESDSDDDSSSKEDKESAEKENNGDSIEIAGETISFPISFKDFIDMGFECDSMYKGMSLGCGASTTIEFTKDGESIILKVANNNGEIGDMSEMNDCTVVGVAE